MFTQPDRAPKRDEVIAILESLAECAIVHNGPEFASPEHVHVKVKSREK